MFVQEQQLFNISISIIFKNLAWVSKYGLNSKPVSGS